jgi:AcrR family transcriptional regulator/DNA-binding MarR family transcriptional regulator
MMTAGDRPVVAAADRSRGDRVSRERVAEVQRARLLAAAVETVHEVGYAGLTVAQVITRARVSRKTFYEVFEDREECILAAFEQTLARMRLLARETYASAADWREGVRCALIALLAFLDDEPALAWLCVVETAAARGAVFEVRHATLTDLAAVIDRGRSAAQAPQELSAITAEGVVGGVLAVLHARLLARERESLTGMFEPLMSMIVLPYLGVRAARRELERPPPAYARRKPARKWTAEGDPLDGLNMRLTYRTVRVLIAIGERPGASNREVAERAGIVDQGQISKLLSRLGSLELIENTRAGSERGAANAWRLTPRGVRVERATRTKLLA